MGLAELLKSREYQDAERKIEGWKGRLLKANRQETENVRDEKAQYFRKLRERKPEVYNLLQIEDKTLSEMIMERLGIPKVIID